MYNKKIGKIEGHLYITNKGAVPLITLHVDYLRPMDTTAKMYKHNNIKELHYLRVTVTTVSSIALILGVTIAVALVYLCKRQTKIKVQVMDQKRNTWPTAKNIIKKYTKRTSHDTNTNGDKDIELQDTNSVEQN